jgi:signal transduction histidine kinase
MLLAAGLLCWAAGLAAQTVGDRAAAPTVTTAESGSPASPDGGEGLPLSEDEAAWLSTRPVLKVALSGGFPPYYFFAEPPGQAAAAARPLGFVIEMMDLWARRSGLQFEFQRYPDHQQAVAAVASGAADLTPFALPDGEREDGLVSLRPAFTSELVLAARRDVPDIAPTGNFGGRTLALEVGSSLWPLLRQRYPQASVQAYPDAEQALRAVSGGAADLYVGYLHVVVYEVERHLLANVVLRSSLGVGALTLGPVMRRDRGPARGVLDKAIASVTAADRSRLAERWLPAPGPALRRPPARAELSPAERAWVERHGRIRVGYDANLAPITLRGELGEFRGFGADVLRLVAAKAGLELELERGGSFSEVYAAGVADELDLVVGMVRTPQRRADYDFVGPFLSLATALFVRSDDPALVTDTADIGARSLALLRDHFLIPQLKSRHPGIRLIEFDRQDQVLSAVAEGAADVGLGNIQVVTGLIERRYASQVRLTGVVRDGDSELYFAVPRQRPELTRVLHSGLAAVSDAELAELRARWLAQSMPTGLDARDLVRVAVPLLLLLGLLSGYLLLLRRGNRRLRAARQREHEARRLAEDSITTRARFLAYLSHELRGGLGALRSGIDLLRDRDDAVLRERLLGAMSKSTDGLMQVLETTLAFERCAEGQWRPEPRPTGLADWWEQVLAPGRLAAQRKGLRFALRWSGPAPTVAFDAVRAQQIVHNLVSNAIKFTPVGQVQVDGHLEHAGDGRAWLSLSVSDEGPGLSEADRSRLFQPYAQGEQGRAAHQGAGLGLAISRELARGMGGELEAVPASTGGAGFRLRLPVEPVPAAVGDAVTRDAA